MRTLLLTIRTKESGPAGKNLAVDQAATALAHLPFATINTKRLRFLPPQVAEAKFLRLSSDPEQRRRGAGG